MAEIPAPRVETARCQARDANRIQVLCPCEAAVANAALMTTDISYVQFSTNPVSYTVEQLAVTINATILEIVEFVRKPLGPR